LHSRLLERAAKYSDQYGGGSLTALPVIETQANDVSAYIPTNVISITDGQIYLEPSLFNAGVRPALNIGISVSRVGGNAQNKAMKKIAGPLKVELAMFRELEAFARFGSDLDKETLAKLTRGARLTEILKQPQFSPIPVEKQIALIFVATKGYLDELPVASLRRLEREFYEYMDSLHPEILNEIKTKKELTKEIEDKLHQAIQKFIENFKKTLK
jgi:F-type H+-transporting ATPase subunit alpha